MNTLAIIGLIFAIIIFVFIIIKFGRDSVKFIIYVLTIPLWIGAMVYYNDIRAYILLGLILAWDIFYIYIYAKAHGWFAKKK